VQEAESDKLNLPAGHSRQVTSLELGSLYLPDAHGSHVEPETEANLPAGHSVHTIEPAGLIEPAGQAVQDDEPPWLAQWAKNPAAPELAGLFWSDRKCTNIVLAVDCTVNGPGEPVNEPSNVVDVEDPS
jgi:hypothetical protein